MYKLVIADDDEILLRGLSSMFDWNALNIQVVASVDDGDKAFLAVKEHQADILLTDIKMTNLDGLQLVEKLKEEKLTTQVVVMSAYDEFQYARQALKLSVNDYLVKPLDLDALKKTMLQLIDSYSEMVWKNQKIEQLEADNKDIQERKFYKAVVMNEYSKEECLERAETFLKIEGQVWELIEIHTESESILPQFRNGLQRFCIDSNLKWIELNQDENLICYCGAETERKEKIDKLKNDCKNLATSLEKDSSVSFLNGSVVKNIFDLHRSYECIKRIQKYLFVENKAVDLYEKDTDYYYNQSHTLNKPMILYLAQIVSNGQEKAIGIYIEKLKYNLKSVGDNSQLMLLYALSIFLVEVNKKSQERGVSEQKLEQLDHIYNEYYKRITQQKKLEDAMYYFEQMAIKFAREIKADASVSNSGLIQKSIQYIEEKFCNPELRIGEVAEYVGLSQNYFSTIFKEETGDSFTDYLIQRRMKEAQHLLVNTDDRSSEIATRVGYDNPTYFSTLFKKYTGVTVSTYRRTIRS